MSDYDDRGAYTPPSDRLAFDRQPVRGGGPAPVTLIVSALALIGLVGGVFFLYRDGFRHRGEAPALVGAPVADVRTPAEPLPAANDAPAAPPAGLVVDKAAAPAPAPAFAPPPQQPLPRVVASAAPPAPPAAASAPPAASKPAPPPPQVVMLAPEAAPKPTASLPKKVVAPPAAHLAAAAPPPPTERVAAHHPSQLSIASLTDAALAHRRADRADRAARSAHEAHATEAAFAEPPILAPPPPRHVVAARIKGSQAMAAAAPVASRSAAWVQIGAFSSPALAEQGWRDVARIEHDSMGGKGRAVQPVDRDDGTRLYRTYVTGFASVTAAQAFCAELQAAARACIVK